MGYYWPSIFRDARKYVSGCDNCQRMDQPIQSDEMPLQPKLVPEPFKKWAIDFVGLINPLRKRIVARYIITATDNLKKWAEAQPVKNCSTETTMKFIFEYI